LIILHNAIKFENNPITIGFINDYGHNVVKKGRSPVVASCIMDNVKGFILSVVVSQFLGNRRGNPSMAIAATQCKQTKISKLLK